ncbi:MAG: hypothetical protein FJ363_07840 [Gemmatimonadetes bacterium]|nr:hypothetical protein [Gemmatimonadota bacterium]
MTDPLPSYALAEPVFGLRSLAVAASRAPLGGPREALLATLVGARLAIGAHGAGALERSLREERAVAARHWMGALSLPSVLRSALGELLDATTRDDSPALAAALAKVTEVTAPHLDRKARSEMDRLARRISA